jgi:hypothetical protein
LVAALTHPVHAQVPPESPPDSLREANEDAALDRDQEVGSRVAGRVVDDESGRPVAQALVTLAPSNRLGLSDSTGAFLLRDVPPGLYRLEVEHIGYSDRSRELEVLSGLTTHVEVRLETDPIELAPLRVEVEYRPRYLEDRGFYARMERGIGTFFDPAFVERWSSGLVLAANLLDVMTYFSPSFRGGAGCGGPVIYVDGRKDRSSPPLWYELSAGEIGAVEFYQSSAGLPDFAMADIDAICGLVSIWTRRWEDLRRRRAPKRIELCVPEFQEGQLTIEGLVRDDFTDVLLPGATVEATVRSGNSNPRRSTTTADGTGWYRFCDLPPGADISLYATAAGVSGVGQSVALGEDRLMRQDLDVRIAGPGRVVGRVLDRETGRPVGSATVSVLGTAHGAVSDGQGYFMLDEVTPGDQVVEIAHLGFETLAEPVSILADRTVDIRAELSADPIELEPLMVTTVRSLRLETRGFYERRQWSERIGQGSFIDQKQIERRNVTMVSHMLGELQGIRIRCDARGCSVGSTRVANCPQLSVYIDGVQVIRTGESGSAGVATEYTIDELVRPSDIAGMEVYPSPSSLPAEFSGPTGRCGAVVIWTR